MCKLLAYDCGTCALATISAVFALAVAATCIACPHHQIRSVRYTEPPSTGALLLLLLLLYLLSMLLRLQVIDMEYVNEAMDCMHAGDVKFRFVIDINKSLSL